MVLPGIRASFGFQLIAVFDQRCAGVHEREARFSRRQRSSRKCLTAIGSSGLIDRVRCWAHSQPNFNYCV